MKEAESRFKEKSGERLKDEYFDAVEIWSKPFGGKKERCVVRYF